MKYPRLITGIVLQLCVVANAAAWWPQDARSGDADHNAKCLLTTAAGDTDGKEKSNKGEKEEEPDCE